MYARSLLASILCASLVSVAPRDVRAQQPAAALSAVSQAAVALSWTAEPVVTSVLGLRGDDDKAANDLTVALRAAFADREMSGGQELTLEEVVLTLDCSSEQDTACMTEAGRALETERLVYGTLASTSDGHTLDIIVLDVTTGQVEAEARMPLAAGALGSGNVDATATDVVTTLYPPPDAVIAATPVNETDDQDDSQEEDRDRRESNLVWGPYKDRPIWKKVGLGIGATLLIGGAGMGIIGGVLAENYYPDQVTQEIARSNADDTDVNDIDPDMLSDEERAVLGSSSRDNCAIASLSGELRTGLERDRNTVINEPVAELCRNGDNAATVANIGWGVMAAGAITTITFTVLYFVHRKDAPPSNARRRHFRLTGGPTRGGFTMGAQGRF